MPKIQYTARACRWFDKVNGNTYHSVKIMRCADGAVLACPWQYGYGDSYRQTALAAMGKAGWLPEQYRGVDGCCDDAYGYERENSYPIAWNVSDGLKRDMVANGELIP